MDDYSWPAELEAIWSDLTAVSFTSGADWWDEARSLFETGWVDTNVDANTRQAARDAFFDLLAQYDISEEHFDWDSWREWYKGVA